MRFWMIFALIFGAACAGAFAATGYPLLALVNVLAGIPNVMNLYKRTTN